MIKKILAFAFAFSLLFVLAACGEDSGEETTVSGMVLSVEGTVIQLVDTGNMGNRGQNGGSGEGDGQRPSMPENWNSEDFTIPEGFDPEQFSGEMPEGATLPEGMEGFDPENFQRPDGQTRPEGEMPTMPEGETRPEGGFSGGGFNMEGVETRSIDIANARIAKEIDGGKESASLSDIQSGTMVTITLNSKGEATYVLITSTGFGSGFGGGNFSGNFGGGNRTNRPEDTTTPTT